MEWTDTGKVVDRNMSMAKRTEMEQQQESMVFDRTSIRVQGVSALVTVFGNGQDRGANGRDA